MEVVVTTTNINFNKSRRMLIKIMTTLNLRLAKLWQFHAPQNRDGKWVWMLVMNINDQREKYPIYFSVDQKTLNSQLTVVRKNEGMMTKWQVTLPEILSGINADEIWHALGF